MLPFTENVLFQHSTFYQKCFLLSLTCIELGIFLPKTSHQYTINETPMTITMNARHQTLVSSLKTAEIRIDVFK